MLKIRTETWSTNKGTVVKAVLRDEKGRIVGATNQTSAVKIAEVKVPTIVGE